MHFLNNVSASVGSVIKPAGYENSQDIISAAYLKDRFRQAVGQRSRHEGILRLHEQGLP